MKLRSHLRFLTFYSAAITMIFVVTVYLGWIRPVHGSRNLTEFDRIRVHRIDVVEPDGTPRLFISNRKDFPGELYHGRELARRDRSDSAGMLFVNDEGTEDGGLIYGGEKGAEKPTSFSHLSFDQYEQDQTVVIGTALQNGNRQALIQLNDAPEKAITPDLIEEADRLKAMPHGNTRKAAWAEYQKRYPALTERATLSRNGDGSVGLVLRDVEGRNRLELSVLANGSPVIKMFDGKGKVRKEFAVEEK